MNYLDLCQRLRSESGDTGTGPTSVTNQTGKNAKIVKWIKDAWIEVQGLRENWRFMWEEDSFSTTVATDNTYDRTAVIESADKDSFKIYKTALGVSDESPLQWVDYREFKRDFLIGTVSENMPIFVAQRPDEALQFYPKPDTDYTVSYWGYRPAQELSANTDIPTGLKERYHMAIVYYAMMKHGGFDNADEVIGRGTQEFGTMFDRMLWTELLEDDDDMVARPE